MSDPHAQVALSYASSQTDYAAKLEDCLRSEGYSVFNYKGPGRDATTLQSLAVDLTEKFVRADLCVLMVDEAYLSSPLCQCESRAAHDRAATQPNCLVLGVFNGPRRPEGALVNAEYVRLEDTPPHQFADRVIRVLRDREVRPGPGPSTQEQRYGLFFGMPGYRTAYIPADVDRPWFHYRERSFESLHITAHRRIFALKKPYGSWPLSQPPRQNLLKCRLDSYTDDGDTLRLQFSATYYEDYLRSGEQIDVAPTVEKSGRTFREKFLGELIPHTGYLRPIRDLTNICGVGLFLITSDNQLVVSTHSSESHVYPGRRTFAASGAMPWGACPHPFTAAVVKAQEEIQHLVDWSKLKLVAFGVDARKLYFQFSFLEDRSSFSGDDILRHYDEWKTQAPNAPRDLKCLDFHEDSICESLVNDCWEPAAEAALLSLLSWKFTRAKVEHALEHRRKLWWRRRMRDEWDHRASRPGLLPDMSARYDPSRLEAASGSYVNDVVAFLRDQVPGKRVVEIGSGTGRVTERLLDLGPAQLVCIELSPVMEALHRKRLNRSAASVEYRSGFAQDELSGKLEFDVAVCSLVLVHNVGDDELNVLLRRLASSAAQVFVFEDVRTRETSPATRIRPELELTTILDQHFRILRSETHHLFEDEILFLHLESKS